MSNKVLYVEDNATQAEVVKHYLFEKNFDVSYATDGLAAKELLAKEKFDVILTDHYMPNLTGLDLLGHIREFDNATPVIFLSSCEDLKVATAVMKMGANDFILKDSEGHYCEVLDSVITKNVEKSHLKRRVKQLKKKLIEEKNLCQSTLNSINQGVIIVDEMLDVVFSNHFFNQTFGFHKILEDDHESLDEVARIFSHHGRVQGQAGADAISSRLKSWLNHEDGSLDMLWHNRYFELSKSRLKGAGFSITFTDVTSQKAQLQSLSHIIDYSPVCMLVVDAAGRILRANKEADAFYMAMATDGLALPNRDISQLLAVSSSQACEVRDLLATSSQSAEHCVVYSGQAFLDEGGAVPVEFSIRSIAADALQHYIVTVIDVSHHKQAELMLSQAFQLTQSIIDNSPFSIAATDAKGLVIAASPALEKMLGYTKEELVEKVYVKQFHDAGDKAGLDKHSKQAAGVKYLKKLMRVADQGGVGTRECLYVKKDGSKIPVHLTVTRLDGYQGSLSGYLFVAYDISKRMRAQRKIDFMAHHDELTKLPNRLLMRDRLQHALLRMKRYGGKVGLILLDLDHFKRINDSLGHQTGDDLLKVVSKRLVKNVRDSDTVCRLGGDEFVIVLPDIEHAKDVERVCEGLLRSITRPIKSGSHVLNVTPSLGYCLAPDNGTTPSALFKNSDIAMYRAKRSGRNNYCSFLPQDGQESAETLCLEQALRVAIETNQLAVHYQPKVDLRTMDIVGFEALVRWEHPELGDISPMRFIPLAEATGLIVPLGEQVLIKACREIGQLCQLHGKDYHVAVNFCPSQFETACITDRIFDAVENSSLPMGGLELEITEGMLMGSSTAMLCKLELLRERGIRITIDDFGTGFSNLAYVAKYPINTIKIDRSFMNIEKKVNSAIINAITQIAEGMDMQVVAEGTESEEQLRFVTERGCHLAQGFYFSKAVSIETLEGVIRENMLRRATLLKGPDQ